MPSSFAPQKFLAQFKLMKLNILNYLTILRIHHSIFQITSEAMHMSMHHLALYYQPQGVLLMAWTALVMWYMGRKTLDQPLYNMHVIMISVIKERLENDFINVNIF